MNTVDQRILIPAPPQVVWEYISDITKNPQWQADCKSVTFLTSKRSGQGTRWRCGMGKGREQVIEVTAWYDGLGYQYTYVDGMPFRESMGRIRLQEIPEGTVVQWTIQYEVGGLLGGMRGSLGMTKQLETMMVTSLKTLWKQVNSSGAAQNWREAKSLMRDAPDAEARSHYKPRHAANDGPPPDAPQTTPARLPVIQEPPIAEDDTRPRPAVATAPKEPAPQPIEAFGEDTAEPDFLADFARFQPPPPDYGNDTQPIKTITAEQERNGLGAPSAPPAAETAHASQAVNDLLAELDAAISEWPAESEPVDLEAFLLSTAEPAQADSAPAAQQEGAPPQEIIPPAAAEPAAPPAEEVVQDASSPSPFSAVTQPIQPAEPELPPALQTIPGVSETTRAIEPVRPTDTAAMDTSQLSIWEIFGVDRPSDTQELRAVKAEQPANEEEPPATAETATTTEPEVSGVVSVDLSRELLLPPQRIGLRLHLRRSSVKLRRPE